MVQIPGFPTHVDSRLKMRGIICHVTFQHSPWASSFSDHQPPSFVQPVHLTMKALGPLSSLLPLPLLFLSPLPSLAVPPYVDPQALFSQKPLSNGMSGDKFQGMAMEWIDDAKKTILKGKEDMERWYHEGREYIKQNNLLCKILLFANILSAKICR